MANLNNFVIDRIVRGVAIDQGTGEILFSINQIQNASLNCASESADAVDAMGTPIATFYRAKSAEFSAENALFDMNLMATQLGTTKKVASSTSKILAPAMESFTTVSGKTTHKLNHVPKDGTIKEIYSLNGDSTFGEKYTLATSVEKVDANTFAIVSDTLTLPKEIAANTEIFVMYEYESENAVEVVNSATKFPVGCKFVMEVLGCDVCDQTELIYAYVIFNNAKLSPDFDWSIATDGTHPFSMKAQQDYCDKEKKLFSIIIPEVD